MRRVLIRQLQSQVTSQYQPNLNAVRMYFEDHKDHYTMAAQVEVRRMPVADAQEGQRVIEQLKAGQDTLALVKKFISLSYGSKAMQGESAVAQALQGPEGSYQGPFASDRGYFILQILHRDAAQVPQFEAVQERVNADLAQEQSNVLFQEFIKELRTRMASQVKIDQEKTQQLATQLAQVKS